MAVTVSPSIQAITDAATSKTGWVTSVVAALGNSRTITVKRLVGAGDPWADGTTIFAAPLTGAVAAGSGRITSFGTTGAATVQAAAALTSGAAVVRIAGGSAWVQGTLGLPGTSSDFTVPSSPTELTGWAFASSFALVAPASVPADAAPPPPPPPPPPPAPSGSTITTIRLSADDNGALPAGSYPYSATVLPLRGQVPAGSRLISPDDPTLASSVVSRYPDNSAAVMVVAGTLSVPGGTSPSLRLQPTTAAPAPALTADAIAALVQSVQVDFGSGFGVASLVDFSSPERVWWSSARVICARYRAAAPTPGSTQLEAVIDVHAYASGQALVEVRVENCKLNPASPAAPASASYTAATIRVNGSVVAGNVNGNGAPEGSHAAFRSWYASGWIGTPAPRAVQAVSDLQRHPLLFRVDQPGGSMAAYAADSYSPWATGRQRASGMGNGGDHASIGPLPLWATHFLQTGDARAARATEVQSLVCLGYGVNYRDSATGRVPTFASVGSRSWNNGAGGWPITSYNGSMGWEVAHQPAEGLMAFIARPSPVFIELAQSIAITSGTYSSASNGSFSWTPGVAGHWYQTRGKAWHIRNLAHAIFLCPDADATWDASALNALARNFDLLDTYRTDSKSVLGFVWDNSPSSFADFSANAGAQHSIWQHHYLLVELHKIASAGLLDGAAQAKATTVADWAALQPVRWVNEQPNGGWRFVPYKDTVGSDPATINSQPTWGQERLRVGNHGTTPPASVSGTWMSGEIVGDAFVGGAYVANANAGAYYPSYFWAALVAAVERNVPGASQAWSTVQANITNLEAWRGGFAADARWGSTPRNVGALATGWGAGTNAGTVVGDMWTPGRDSNGVINLASVQLLESPTNTLRFYEVANTRLDQLDSAVKEQMLAKYGQSWADVGVSRWNGVTDAWVGVACDYRAGFERAWIGPGGGHDASSNNGLYRYDIRRMTVNIQRLPSASHVFPAGYKGATVYPLSAPVGQDQNGVAYDEIFDLSAPNDPVRSPRDPTSRHTYEALVFAPDLGDQGALLFCCRRAWRYDMATDTWATPRAYFNNAQMETFTSSENMSAWWDSTRKRYFHMGNSAPSSGASRNFWWDGGANFGTDGAYLQSGWWTTTTTAQQHGQVVWALTFAQVAPSGDFNRPIEASRLDIATQQITRYPLTIGSSFDGWEFPDAVQSGYYDRSGVVYVPTLNKLLACTNIRPAGGGQIQLAWIWIDCATWVVDRATDLQGAVSSPFALEGKIKHFPDAGLIVHFTPANQNLRVARIG